MFPDAPDPAAAIADLYERHAARWEADRGERLEEGRWLNLLTNGLPPGAAILDIGCGNGRPIAAELLRRGFRVIGVDSSPSLIRSAAAALPTGEWVAADMRALALGRRFNAIIAWHSFFHLSRDDQRATVPRFAAHAAPGARLMFTSGPEDGVAIGEWAGEPLHHASLSSGEYRTLLAANGFTVESFTGPEPADPDPTVWTALYINPASGLDGSA